MLYMRVQVHVRPNVSRAGVGGVHDGALVVRVSEPASGGRATEAALRALSEALGVPRSSIALVHGGTSRRKLIEVTVTEAGQQPLTELIARLSGSSGSSP